MDYTDKLDLLVSKLEDKGWDIDANDIALGLDFIPGDLEDLSREDAATILEVIAAKESTGDEDTVSVSNKSIDEFYKLYLEVFKS